MSQNGRNTHCIKNNRKIEKSGCTSGAGVVYLKRKDSLWIYLLERQIRYERYLWFLYAGPTACR